MNTDNVPRDQRKALLEKCSSFDADCLGTVRGKAQPNSFEKIAATSVTIEQSKKIVSPWSRGRLGVTIFRIDDTIAENLKIGDLRGAIILDVDVNSPAKAAGLQEKDLIIKFAIKEPRGLPRLSAVPDGKEVQLVILSGGREQTKTVTFGQSDANENPPPPDIGKQTRPH